MHRQEKGKVNNERGQRRGNQGKKKKGKDKEVGRDAEGREER